MQRAAFVPAAVFTGALVLLVLGRAAWGLTDFVLAQDASWNELLTDLFPSLIGIAVLLLLLGAAVQTTRQRKAVPQESAER